MIVSGKSSSLTRRAAAIFFSNDRLPAIRSLSCAFGAWIEICTWSSPADFSSCARSGVNSVPAVISDEYRPASRARLAQLGQVPAQHRLAAGERELKDAEAARLTERPEPVLGLELVAVRLATDVERVRAVRAVQRALVGELGDQRRGPNQRHRPRAPFGHRVDQLAHVVAHVGAAVALGERADDVVEGTLAVTQLEHLRRRGVQPHRTLGNQQQMLLAYLVVAQAGAGHEARTRHALSGPGGCDSPRSIASSCAHRSSVLNLKAATAASCCSRVRQRSTTRSSAYCASRGACTSRLRKYSRPAGSIHS